MQRLTVIRMEKIGVERLEDIFGAVVVPLVRRLPAPVAGVELNFCRNPACAHYGVLPDPFKRPQGSPPAPAGVPRGAVPGGKHQDFYKCSACGTTSRVKNNRAVVEEHERMRRQRDIDPCAPACRTVGSANQDLPVSEHPGLYQSFGKTKGGDPRWRCKACAKTFSTGGPARRHKRSDKNRLILDMLCNDLSLAKTAKISGLSTATSTGGSGSTTIRSGASCRAERISPGSTSPRWVPASPLTARH